MEEVTVQGAIITRSPTRPGLAGSRCCAGHTMPKRLQNRRASGRSEERPGAPRDCWVARVYGHLPERRTVDRVSGAESVEGRAERAVLAMLAVFDNPEQLLEVFCEWVEGEDTFVRDAALTTLAGAYLQHYTSDGENAAQETLLDFAFSYPHWFIGSFCRALADVYLEIEEQSGSAQPATSPYAVLGRYAASQVALMTVVEVLLEGYPSGGAWWGTGHGGVTTMEQRVRRDGAAVLFLDDESLLVEVLQAGGPLGELAWLRLHDLIEDTGMVDAIAESLGVLAKELVGETWEPRLSRVAAEIARDAYRGIEDLDRANRTADA